MANTTRTLLTLDSSSYAFRSFDISTEEKTKELCGVIRNFLNYVLRHEVCPEFTENILAAREVCVLAEKEHARILKIQCEFPGPFNHCASSLYGKQGKCLTLVSNDSGNSNSRVQRAGRSVEPEIDQGSKWVVRAGLESEGTPAMIEAFNNDAIHIVKTHDERYIEVVKIERVSAEAAEKYSYLSIDCGGLGKLTALGKIQVKPWTGPGHFTDDMTDDEDDQSTGQVEPVLETFWVEDALLENVFVGLKVCVDTAELNIGINIIEAAYSMFCSFYVLLDNEKVIDKWKEPGKKNPVTWLSFLLLTSRTSTEYQTGAN